MNMHSDLSESSPNARPLKRRSAAFRILGVVTFVLILAAILIPGQVVSRLARDEASAIGSLHRLTVLQLRYKTAHPSSGFACELVQLKADASSNREYMHETFLLSDSSEGYKFSLTGCEADPHGVVTRYKVTAAPLLPGKTGVRAFCTDQTGRLWYAVNGSGETCLAERRSLNGETEN
jgi:hypothetical protein